MFLPGFTSAASKRKAYQIQNDFSLLCEKYFSSDKKISPLTLNWRLGDVSSIFCIIRGFFLKYDVDSDNDTFYII